MKYEMMINNGWAPLFKEEEKKQYFQTLLAFIETEYKNKTIYPDKNNIFKAFELTDFNDTNVLILGQDPYHEEGQAQGLCFSVPVGLKTPPSLKNIYKEILSDLGHNSITDNDLTSWGTQGVLLLNTVLTVEEHKPNSHKKSGWLNLTNEVVKKLSDKGNVVFVLWGNNAINYEKYIDTTKNYIVKSVHPSPLSAYNGFFNSKPFSKINEYLQLMDKPQIKW